MNEWMNKWLQFQMESSMNSLNDEMKNMIAACATKPIDG